MKALLAITIIAIIFTANAFAQESGVFFQAVAGKWQGTLEYADYTSNKRVTMNTLITFKPSADNNSAETFTIYDDFGKVYKSNGKERIDAAARKFYEGETEFTIESSEPGKLVLIGKTQDGNSIEPTRKTITYTNDTLTILKETRSPWTFRHVYTFKKVTENNEPEKTLSAAQLQEDFAVFKKTLTTIHPGIYRYNTPETLEKEFNTLEAKLQSPLKESEFFIMISQFTNKIKCGHTYANPYNQDGNLKNRLFERKNHLPFYFQIVDGKIIITENASSKDIAKGSEITKINGVAAKEIIEKLLTVTKADGNATQAHRINSLQLTRTEAENYALFDWYFPLFFPMKDEIFTVEAVDFATKKPTNFQILAMTKTERTVEMAKRYGTAPTFDDGWKYEIRDDSTAVLKIDNSLTWRLKTVKFKDFLAKAFAEFRAKNVKNLIIDLRGNGGGDMDVGYELARYLAQTELPVYAESRRLVRNVAPQTELAKYLQTYNDGLKTALQKGVPKEIYKPYGKNFFEILPNENTDNYPKVTPYENNFRGRSFIIADAAASSATFQFLNYVRENKLAKIVGQTSGGNRQGINGGSYFFLYLPNSKIETDIPAYFQAPLAPQKDESVAPDVPVKRRPADIGDNLDRELLTIENLIARK